MFSKTTPRELRRRAEPKRPTEKEQNRILAKIRKAEVTGSDADHEEIDDDDDGDDVEIGDVGYVVESVVGHFHTQRGFWFLVKWEGYASPTWEHESLLDAGRRVTDYFKNVCEHQT